MDINNNPTDLSLKLLTYIDLDEREKGQILMAVQKIDNWDSWYEIASFNKILPICYYSLKELNIQHHLPADIWLKLENEANFIRNKNQLRNEEAAFFLEEFRKNNIKTALLKGVAFGEIVYKNPYYKRMNDIDILIKKEDIVIIYNIYDSLGYFYIGERISGSKVNSDRVSHLSPPFVSRNYDCVIGTQWGIKTPLSPYKINYKALWERTNKTQFMGGDILVLSPEDNLLHLCLHLGYFKISLRDMMDFYNLLRAFQDQFNWNRFFQIVEESRTHNPVYFGLKLFQYICPIAEVEIFLDRIKDKVGTFYKNAIAWKTRSMDVFLHMHSDHIQTIEKAISTFDSTSYFPEKWVYFRKLWGCILCPPNTEIVRMSALYSPSWIQFVSARLTIPFKILRVIAEEVGWTLLFLLTIKTFVALILSLAKYPFVSRNQSDTEAFAKKLRIPMDKLVELKEQFQ